MFCSKRCLRLGLGLFIALAALSASAATKTWNGLGSGNWATGANWSDGIAPAAGDDLVFPLTASRLITTNNFSPNRAFNSVTFLSGYTVRGNPLIITNGLRCGHSTTLSLFTTVTLGGAQSCVVSNATALLLLSGSVLDLAGFNLTIDGNGRTDVSAAIGGSGGIVKNGTNILQFLGTTTNTYAGTTLVNAGRLQLNKTGATAVAGPLTIGDGSGGAAADVVEVLANDQISNSAAITLNSSGLLKLGNSVLEDIGALTLAGGKIEAPFGSGELGLLANVTSQASAQTATLSGNISFAASRTFTVADGGADPDVHFLGGNLRDSAGKSSFTKNGPGTLRQGFYSSLGGTNIIREGVFEAIGTDPVGHTVVSNNAVLRVIGTGTNFPIIGFTLILNGSGDGKGALQLEGSSSGWRGPVHFASHSTIGIYGSTNVFIIGATNGQLTGPGGFTKIGDGTLRLTNKLASTYGGVTYINAGVLELGNAAHSNAIPGTLVIGNGSGGPDADVVRLLTGNQIADVSQVTINSSGWLDGDPLPAGQSERFGSLILNNAGHVSALLGGQIGVEGNLTCNGAGTAVIESAYFYLFAPSTVHVSDANGILDIRGALGPVDFNKTGPGRLRVAANIGTPNIGVLAGIYEATLPSSLGGTGGSVNVASGATLQLRPGTYPAIPLTLNGAGASGAGGALRASVADTNTIWTGPVTLSSDSIVWVSDAGFNQVRLYLTNVVGGPGKLILDGGGFLQLSGSAANTYSGGTLIKDGYLDLMKTSGVTAIPGNVVIDGSTPGTSPDLHLSAANQIANGFDLTMNGGMFDLNTFAETIGTLNGAGAVTLGPGSALNVSPGSGVTCNFDGTLTSPGNLVKSGSGTLILSRTNTFTGTTTINGGVLRVNGSHPNSPVNVNASGQLQGYGSVATIALAGGTSLVSPGASPGILVCSNLNATGTGSGILGFELGGTTPGTGHDQLDVRGTVNLNGLLLGISTGSQTSLSNQYVVIKNDGADAVVGNFIGLPQNAIASLAGEQFQVVYNGGDGNDVVLTQLSGAFHPKLGIERVSTSSVRLYWPTNQSAGYSLQSNTNLALPGWATASPGPVIVGTNYISTNSTGGTQRYFRLHKP